MSDYFIQNAIEHKGALRNYVEREYGKKGFDHKGRIKTKVLKDIEKKYREGKVSRLEDRRAILALTLRGLRSPSRLERM